MRASSLHQTRAGINLRKNWKLVLIWIVLGLGSVVMLLPFYWLLVTSFKFQKEILTLPVTWWPSQPTVQNWINAIRVANFGRYFLNSTFVCTILTVANLITSALAGYVFARYQFRGREALFLFILSGLMIPFFVPLIPLYVMMVKFNWNDSYWSIIIPSLYTPLGVFLLRQYIHSIPGELFDAARVDGAGEFTIFFRIVLPLCMPALAALGVFSLITNWNDFLWPFIVLDQPQLWTLPVGLARLRGRFGTDYGLVMAASTITILPLVVFYFLAQRRIIEGIAMTGIKG
jgi:ABC-type glycerol-3-phosphate transport system permease component